MPRTAAELPNHIWAEYSRAWDRFERYGSDGLFNHNRSYIFNMFLNALGTDHLQDKHIPALRLLAGENGWVIYCALLARQGKAA